jgi:hypothetical protein
MKSGGPPLRLRTRQAVRKSDLRLRGRDPATLRLSLRTLSAAAFEDVTKSLRRVGPTRAMNSSAVSVKIFVCGCSFSSSQRPDR